jgi:hypothetical protein
MHYLFDDKTTLGDVREFCIAVVEFKYLRLFTKDIHHGLYDIIADAVINSSIVDLSWWCPHYNGHQRYYDALIKIAKCNQLVSLVFTNATLSSVDVYEHLTVSKLSLHVSLLKNEHDALKNNRYITEFCLYGDIGMHSTNTDAIAKQNRDRIDLIRQKCLIILHLPVYRDIRTLMAKYVWHNRYVV